MDTRLPEQMVVPAEVTVTYAMLHLQAHTVRDTAGASKKQDVRVSALQHCLKGGQRVSVAQLLRGDSAKGQHELPRSRGAHDGLHFEVL